MSMLKELIQEKHSREKSKSNERGVCPIFRGIAHIVFRLVLFIIESSCFDNGVDQWRAKTLKCFSHF
jgi:hypothetical protein